MIVYIYNSLHHYVNSYKSISCKIIGAVLHSHAMCCNIVTSLFEGYNEFKISHQEMIKGIEGYGYFDTLIIPIIENTAWEHELADSLGEAIAKYPKACAVLVRRHGMYVWGSTWEQAKRHGECLHYLFEIAIKMHNLGLDFNAPPRVSPVSSLLMKRSSDVFNSSEYHVAKRVHSSSAFKYLLLDIEGTTTPITFVKDILFPFAAGKVEKFLRANFTNDEVYDLVKELRENAKLETTSAASNIISDLTIESATEYALWLIKEDRKVTPLKKLQGMIWDEGYLTGALVGMVYDDVAVKLQQLSSEGVKTFIYSSGSKKAQQLLFGRSNHGDLRKYLSGYFDTTVGLKASPDSYKEILLTLGIDDATDALFITDILAEAEAASKVGLQVLLSVRPGNAEITKQHSFRTITSFNQI